MNLKKTLLYTAVIFSFIFARGVSAITVVQNGGIIPSTIWYSKEPLVEGDVVKIHTIVYDNESQTLYGTVVFMDGEVLLGKKDFKAEPGTVSDISIVWQVTSGNHNISASIQNAHIIDKAGKSETITITKNETPESKQFIEHKVVFRPTDDTTKTVDTVFDQVGKVEKTASDIIPAPVKEIASSVFGGVENWRDANSKSTDTKIGELKNSLTILPSKDAPKNTLPTKQKFGDRPLDYLKMFALQAWAFLVGSKIVFYGLSALVLFLVLRFIWRKIFRR